MWFLATEPYPAAHFATFPEKLVEPCILAGTSARGACPTCGAPWRREVEPSPEYATRLEKANDRGDWYPRADTLAVRSDGTKHGKQEGGILADYRTVGWFPTCACPCAEPVPCRVLDPFAGSGTTVAVAERLGRVGIGVELKPAYLMLARRRTVQAGLL